MTNTEKFTKRQSTKIIYYWLHWLNETDRLTIFNQFSNVLKMFLIVLVTSCSCE
ncbi:zinc finger MYM-type protein 1-like [Aphis craccivora]|uniref:Zinc finger MYM-type protein 1-like n=1 Tax=Aphis craccivora TaxID=307492 RepID=A0A6G0YRD2_APHCR|nr:zinc finger MYM-type protein 1-like [Aphis craccivora]